MSQTRPQRMSMQSPDKNGGTNHCVKINSPKRKTYALSLLLLKHLDNQRATRRRPNDATQKKLFTLLDLCVSSLRRGHANLLCIVPILTDDPRRESI